MIQAFPKIVNALVVSGLEIVNHKENRSYVVLPPLVGLDHVGSLQGDRFVRHGCTRSAPTWTRTRGGPGRCDLPSVQAVALSRAEGDLAGVTQKINVEGRQTEKLLSMAA